MKKPIRSIIAAEPENQSGYTLLPEQFFDFYDPVGAKEVLWKWLVVTVTDGYSTCTPVEKENIVTLYERVSALLEGMSNALKSKSPDHHE